DLRVRLARADLHRSPERTDPAVPARGPGCGMTMSLSIDDPVQAGPSATARERFDRLYAIIRDRICTLEYPPGMRLSEEVLAAEFGVSRTPVRRVLTRLETEGLVEARHGVGTIVTDADLAELAQFYPIRMELAVLVGRL